MPSPRPFRGVSGPVTSRPQTTVDVPTTVAVPTGRRCRERPRLPHRPDTRTDRRSRTGRRCPDRPPMPGPTAGPNRPPCPNRPLRESRRNSGLLFRAPVRQPLADNAGVGSVDFEPRERPGAPRDRRPGGVDQLEQAISSFGGGLGGEETGRGLLRNGVDLHHPLVAARPLRDLPVAAEPASPAGIAGRPRRDSHRTSRWSPRGGSGSASNDGCIAGRAAVRAARLS